MGKIVFGILGLLALTLASTAQERAVVDFEADNIRPIKRGDSTIIKLIDNVTFFHNGAVIQCDSAYRYNDKNMDGFGNVIINKDSTYVYGDKFTYDGNTNVARVLAPIVKLVDKDAILYTYNLEFNTLDNRGWYTGGGAMSQKTNQMESENGVYNANSREVIFRDSVVMRNPDYLMKTDSVSYNMNTEIVTFLDKTKIWSKNGEFLTSDRGHYNQATAEYKFTRDAYIMTDEREIWADSMRYVEPSQSVYMTNNIQILDTVQQVLAFGDYGYYLGDQRTALLTDSPSLINYEVGGDSLYMRSDTIVMFTYKKGEFKMTADSLSDETAELMDDTMNESMRQGMEDHQQMMKDAMGMMAEDSLINSQMEGIERLAGQRDSTAVDSVEVISEVAADGAVENPQVIDTIVGDEPPRRDVDDKTAGEVDGKKVDSQADEQSDKRGDKRTEKDLAEDDAKTDKVDKADEKADEKVEPTKKKREVTKKQIRKQQEAAAKAAAKAEAQVAAADEAPRQDSLVADSLPLEGVKRLGDTLQVSGSEADSIVVAGDPADTLDRVIKAYYNVKMYRSDFQAVCDSMISYSIDSTIRMYIKPVLWNEANQLTAEYIIMHTKNQAMYKADFMGQPFLCAAVEDTLYNQVSGKRMESFFKNNSMDYTNVIGNAMAYYYMEEDGGIMGFMTTVSADMTIYTKNKELSSIIWRDNPEYAIYPLDKIPVDQPVKMKEFIWQPEKRPASRQEICSRPIHLSLREEIDALVKPEFTITEIMDAEKQRLIQAGLWRDRQDDITVDPNKFQNTIFQ